jgi:hypothetical protein
MDAFDQGGTLTATCQKSLQRSNQAETQGRTSTQTIWQDYKWIGSRSEHQAGQGRKQFFIGHHNVNAA